MPTTVTVNGQTVQVPTIEGTNVPLPLPPGALNPNSPMGQARDAVGGAEAGLPPGAQIGVIGENPQAFADYLDAAAANNPQAEAAINGWASAKTDVLAAAALQFPEAAPYITGARVLAPGVVDKVNTAIRDLAGSGEGPVQAAAGGAVDVAAGLANLDFDRVLRGLSTLLQPWRWFSGPSLEEMRSPYLQALQAAFGSASPPVLQVDDFWFKGGESRQFAEDALKAASDGDSRKLKDVWVNGTLLVTPLRALSFPAFGTALEAAFRPARNWSQTAWQSGVLAAGGQFYVDMLTRETWPA